MADMKYVEDAENTVYIWVKLKPQKNLNMKSRSEIHFMLFLDLCRIKKKVAEVF